MDPLPYAQRHGQRATPLPWLFVLGGACTVVLGVVWLVLNYFRNVQVEWAVEMPLWTLFLL